MDVLDVVDYLREALDGAWSEASVVRSPADSGSDISVMLGDEPVEIDVKIFSLVDGPRGVDLATAGRSNGDNVLLVVGDRVVARAKEELTAAGISWLDLRGQLRLALPGLVVMRDVPPYTGPSRQPVRGRVAVATAVDLLLTPDRPASVRAVARRISASAGAVSGVLQAFAGSGLMTPDRLVEPTAMFDWLSRAWRPVWYPCLLSADPIPEMRNAALGLGFDDPDQPGWSLTGDHAALALGAKLSISSTAPKAFYLPTARSLRLARSALRDAPAPTARTHLALAPVAAACARRIDVASWEDEHWLTARPLFVALELAQDAGRGREILTSFDPVVDDRVW